MARFRHQLTELVGGNPNGAQHALIERACWLQLHIGRMDSVAAKAGALTDPKVYLAWNNALTKILIVLGARTTTETVSPPSVHDLFGDAA